MIFKEKPCEKKEFVLHYESKNNEKGQFDMRMRKKKHGEERILACRALLLDLPETPICGPHPHMAPDKKIALEIGCGKGGFACAMAEKYPDIAFFAMEKIANVMICALERAKACADLRPEDNLRFMIADARDLSSWFAPNSVEYLYLNFSDPWPKARHAERRLTHRAFLQSYFSLLTDTGVLQFKTDNVGLFDFTLEEIAALGLTPEVVTRDLHHSPYAEDNVMTEYEQNFSSQGYPIHMLRLRKPK